MPTGTQPQLRDALVRTLFQGVVLLHVPGGVNYAAPQGNAVNQLIQSAGPFAWRAVFARGGGYWVYRNDMGPDANGLRGRCWQVNPDSGHFAFWNFDGRATGYPENWEQMIFEDANISARPLDVRVKAMAGRYLQWTGDHYDARGTAATAATFTPEFP